MVMKVDMDIVMDMEQTMADITTGIDITAGIEGRRELPCLSAYC